MFLPLLIIDPLPCSTFPRRISRLQTNITYKYSNDDHRWKLIKKEVVVSKMKERLKKHFRLMSAVTRVYTAIQVFYSEQLVNILIYDCPRKVCKGFSCTATGPSCNSQVFYSGPSSIRIVFVIFRIEKCFERLLLRLAMAYFFIFTKS